MHLRTYKAEKLPCIVTVWDEDSPLWGKACNWIDRHDKEICKIELNGEVVYISRKHVAIGDNSYAANEE